MRTRLSATIALALAFALACTTAGLATAAWAPTNANHFDGRSPDTKDAAAAHASQSRTTAAALTARVDGRSPDTQDAAAAAHATPSPVIIVGSTGFDWTDAGIGAATGLGLAVVLGAGLALARSRRALTTT